MQAGFPFFQLDRFLKMLVQDLNKYVAISEEFANNAVRKIRSGGLLFDRKVTRVITPGTLVDEKFMDPYANNFLLAIHSIHHDTRQLQEGRNNSATRADFIVPPPHDIGLAWLDLSTGEFYTQITGHEYLQSALARIKAREVVMSAEMEEVAKKRIMDSLNQEELLITWQPGSLSKASIEEWTPMLESPVPIEEGSKFSDMEVSAGTVLLSYVRNRLLGTGIKLQPPVKRQALENMTIDKNSMRGLEVLATSRDAIDGGKGSLLHCIRKTVTKSGARLLRDRISSPSTSLAVIHERLDIVEIFINEEPLREDVVSLLQRTFDSQRLVQKFSLGRGDADDLVSLLRTILATQNIASLLDRYVEQKQSTDTQNIGLSTSLSVIFKRLIIKGPDELATRIAEAIDEDGLMASRHEEQNESTAIVSMAQEVLSNEGDSRDLEAMSSIMRSKDTGIPKGETIEGQDTWIMRREANDTLKGLHDDLSRLNEEKGVLLSNMRQQIKASSLSLRWTPGLGYICHVKGVRDVRASMENFGSARNVSTSKSTRSFYHPEWSSLGGRVDQTKLQIRAEEQRIFQSLREMVVKNLVKLRRNAAVLDEMDIACSSARLAIQQGLVRPILNDGTSHKIVAGRHPTVKLGLDEQGRAFVSNDCFVGDIERIWLITGPNMAGKSTFLRQNALISILAQTGLYVPAQYAEIGIVDQLFSRIGSADNLFQAQSTFMVEMLETADILKQATPRSFVIMDEVGRGTAPEDGMAVGYACLHHLYHVNKCRTLFATHFHALADMTTTWDLLGRYCTDVRESQDQSFTYVHRLHHGVNRESHALKVAQLAGNM